MLLEYVYIFICIENAYICILQKSFKFKNLFKSVHHWGFLESNVRKNFLLTFYLCKQLLEGGGICLMFLSVSEEKGGNQRLFPVHTERRSSVPSVRKWRVLLVY